MILEVEHLLASFVLYALSPKLILLPLGILAFLIFLMILGAFGLFSALAIIGSIGWVFGRLTGRGRRRRGAEGAPSAGPVAATGRRLFFWR
jgi:hypothetical protein